MLLPSKWKIFVTPKTSGGTCKKLLFSSQLKDDVIPTVDVAVVVVIPTGSVAPGHFDLSISVWVI